MFPARQYAVGQDRFFRFLIAFRLSGGDNIRLVLCLVLLQIINQTRLRFVRHSLHNRPVGLSNQGMRPEHLIEAGEGFGSACKKDYSAGGTVKAMRDTQKDFSRLAILLLDIGLHHLRERSIAGLIALYNFVTGLVNRYNMIVFVEYLHS